MTAPAHQPNPALIFETMNAFQRSAALKAAIELDMFTAIGEGHNTPAKLATRCGAAERGARILCDYLTVHGLLAKQNGHYTLPPDTALFLDRRSFAYLGSATQFLLSPFFTESYKDIGAVVRKGGTILPQNGSIAPENPAWVDFAHGMAPLMVFPAEGIAELLRASEEKPWKVLDIAAGHGLFGITLAKHNPNAQIVAVDWPNVLEVAKANAAKFDVAGRYSTIPGSAFDVDYGSGYDVVLLTNFLHHFDAPTCEVLLRKVHAALAPGGRAVTLELVPNDDRITPAIPAAFALIMLATTPSGDAYTFAELDRMFRNAGFSRSELHPLPPTFQSALISHK